MPTPLKCDESFFVARQTTRAECNAWKPLKTEEKKARRKLQEEKGQIHYREESRQRHGKKMGKKQKVDDRLQ